MIWIAGPLPGSEPGKGQDPLAAWRTGVVVGPVTPGDRHTIHSYFLASPESPDARWVLCYASHTPEGYEGDVRIVERATGQQRVIARNVAVEDAHRAACQQWFSQGKRVVFHNVRDGKWLVAAVDLDSGGERVLVRDRQLGFGQPQADLAPLYGCHWNPGEHRDLQFANLKTGAVETVLTAAAVKTAYPQWIARQFGDRTTSIFFPVVSPDLKRVFFKMATPAGGGFRSNSASTRQGLVCYDLAQAKFLLMREKWGHPAWHPDSRQILEVGSVLIDSDSGTLRRIPGLPVFRGSHPSVSPDGKLFVSDTTLEALGGKEGDWGIVVGRLDGGDYVIIHRFNNSRGAHSWRRSHPHPSFSADGKRIYYNVSSDAWTRLYVAESKQ
jgi:hypothetical protein